jgi:hypothetical protein
MPNYDYIATNAEQIARMTEIREKAKELEATNIANVDNCRERSVAITNLETTVMWATKAVCLTPR